MQYAHLLELILQLIVNSNVIVHTSLQLTLFILPMVFKLRSYKHTNE